MKILVSPEQASRLKVENAIHPVLLNFTTSDPNASEALQSSHISVACECDGEVFLEATVLEVHLHNEKMEYNFLIGEISFVNPSLRVADCSSTMHTTLEEEVEVSHPTTTDAAQTQTSNFDPSDSNTGSAGQLGTVERINAELANIYTGGKGVESPSMDTGTDSTVQGNDGCDKKEETQS